MQLQAANRISEAIRENRIVVTVKLKQPESYIFHANRNAFFFPTITFKTELGLMLLYP